MGEESGKGQGRGSSVAATAQATIVAGTREPKQGPYTSSSRPPKVLQVLERLGLRFKKTKTKVCGGDSGGDASHAASV